MYKNENDYELLYLISENNEEAKEMFFEKYKPFIVTKANYLYPQIKNKGYDISDLIQEGMIGLSRAINDYKEQKNIKFSSFANVCIERQMLTFIRDITRQKHKLLNDSLSIDSDTDNRGVPLKDSISDDRNSNPEDSFIRDVEEKNLFDRVRSILSDREYEVFELRLNGFTYQEISMLLNVTEKSVGGTVRRIKDKISKLK